MPSMAEINPAPWRPTMTVVYLDSPMSDDERRDHLFRGHFFIYTPTPALRALTDFARKMTQEAFAPLDPTEAQHHMHGDAYTAVLAKVRPEFINHAHTKQLVADALGSLGADVEQTYF